MACMKDHLVANGTGEETIERFKETGIKRVRSVESTSVVVGCSQHFCRRRFVSINTNIRLSDETLRRRSAASR